MATGNSAKQHWASLNTQFLSNTSLFVNFLVKTFVGQAHFQSTCHGATELKK